MIIIYETVKFVIITAIETRNSFENKSRGNLLIQKNLTTQTLVPTLWIQQY